MPAASSCSVELGTRQLKRADDLVGGVETLRRGLRLWGPRSADFAYEELAQAQASQAHASSAGRSSRQLAAAELSLGRDY